MQAVILVGGKGTRLRPLTYAEPKQMLPILGEPMLESVMQNLARHGVTKAVLSLGYLPDRFQAAYPNGVVAGIPVTYAVEPEPLDTAGAIRFAALAAGIDDTFVVVNGDVLTDLDLTRLVSFHTSKGAKATLALHPVDDPSRFGVVPTDEEGRVVAFIEKPPRDEAPTNEINAGTYVLEPSVIDTIEADVPVSVERVTFPALAANGELYALADAGYWLDTGTPEAYLEAHFDVLSGRRALPGIVVADGSWIAPTAQIGANVTVRSATIGAGSVIGDGAVIEESVIMDNVTVGAGAVIRHSVVGGGSRVGANSQLPPTTVVGYDETIAPDTTLNDDARIGGPR